MELVEDDPAFLRGYGRVRDEMSPVRIMKNPDGSLAQVRGTRAYQAPGTKQTIEGHLR